MKAKKNSEGYFLSSKGDVTHFNESEFLCKCGNCDYDDMGQDIIDMLHALRLRAGTPIIVTSGLRCPTHNVKVGGAPNSRHVPDADGAGHAADIYSTTFSSPRLYLMHREQFQISGTGLYTSNKSLHVDDRPSRMEWIDKASDRLKIRDHIASLMEGDLWNT